MRRSVYVAALAELAAKCDRLGIEHSPVQNRGPMLGIMAKTCSERSRR